ncbi:MAG: YggU family protein [Betaproteobacteria bacterium]|nr:MAG: YggU family protein [Betaproteobacteria bacterium]
MHPGGTEGWLRGAADGSIILSLHVQPAAKQTGFAGLHGDAMKIRLAAPPVDGKANAALCAFLAQFCGVPKSAVTLLSGETSRAKRVRVQGAAPEAVARLHAQAG